MRTGLFDRSNRSPNVMDNRHSESEFRGQRHSGFVGGEEAPMSERDRISAVRFLLTPGFPRIFAKT
jgi:hypothetical protein